MSKTRPIKTIRVKLTRRDTKCPNPSTGKPLEYGKIHTVPDAPYWHRRIRDKVVEQVIESETPEKPEPKTPPAK